MKILKHGDLQPRKFTCTSCGCEFVADKSEYGYEAYTHNYSVYCPDCRSLIWAQSNAAPLHKEETCDDPIDSMSDDEVRIYCKMIHKKLLELCNEKNIYV